MGRKLRRVPMSFDWPLNKVWGGFLNPFYSQSTECTACDSSGSSPEAKRFSDEWYGHAPFDAVAYGATPLTVDHPAIQAHALRNMGTAIPADVQREARRLHAFWSASWGHQLIQADVDALVAEDRLYDFTRTPRTEEQAEIVRKRIADGHNSWLPEPNGYTPTADEVNDWSMRGMGHDAINQWVCVRARCVREGVTDAACTVCSGEGRRWPSSAIKKQYDDWKPKNPPRGKGYQLWETTSEGSPQSPVFATVEELARWCATNATAFGSRRQSFEAWMATLTGKSFGYVDPNIPGAVFI